QSLIDHFRDKAAFVATLADEGEIPEFLIFFEGNIGLQLIIAVDCAIPLLQELFVGGGRGIAKESCETGGKGIEVFEEAASVLFAEPVGAKIDIDVEIGYRSAQHAAVFAVNGATLGIQFDKFLMEAIAEAFPVGALRSLDIQRFPEHHQR